ncbi:hypothetical protein I3760_16G090400 [Carya illinoinensis]|nr:hypothetical protein I3760_16G090400 [Carya illinoinensis]
MYFTNLLSQDPQLDPNYGGQSGTSLMTFDDSPPLPPNEPIGVRKSVRGANFTPEEDKLLVSTWLNCSLDAVQGTLDKAKVMYQSLEKCSFQFEHCWHLLKNQPKWIWRATKEDPKRKKTMSLSPTPTRCSGATVDSFFDLEANNVMENEEKEFYRLKAEKMEYDKGKEEKKLRLEDERLRLEAEKMIIDWEKELNKIHQEDERQRLEA